MPERVDGPSSPPLRLGVIAIYLLLEWVIIAALDRNVVGAVPAVGFGLASCSGRSR